MTEEEKKAIEWIKAQKGIYYKTVINLIQKQDTEINKLKKINDLMASSILNYDDQLEINYYKDKKHVKETFEEFAMKEDK